VEHQCRFFGTQCTNVLNLAVIILGYNTSCILDTTLVSQQCITGFFLQRESHSFLMFVIMSFRIYDSVILFGEFACTDPSGLRKSNYTPPRLVADCRERSLNVSETRVRNSSSSPKVDFSTNRKRVYAISISGSIAILLLPCTVSEILQFLS